VCANFILSFSADDGPIALNFFGNSLGCRYK
jgi:hypothetical protein